MAYRTGCVWSLILITFQLKSTNGVQPDLLSEVDLRATRRTTSHLACECPDAFFSKGTLSIFTAADICRSQQRETTMDIGADRADIGSEMDSNKMANTGKLIPMTMEICQSCAAGCSLCLGPDENDCLKCLPGYLINYFQDAVKPGSQSGLEAASDGRTDSRRKRRSSRQPDSENQNIGKRIYEQEELLLLEMSATYRESSGRSRRRISLKHGGLPPDTSAVDESPAYVDDNFMSYETDDGSSGYAEAHGTVSPKSLRGSKTFKDNVLSQPIDKNKEKLFADHYENIESDLHEQESLILNTGDVPVTDSDAIQWHGSSPFSCVLACPENFYADEDRICQACHGQCDGCRGNGPEHCHRCRHFYEDGRCVAACRGNGQVDDVSVNNCSVLPIDQQLRGRSREERIAVRIPLGYYVLPPLIVLAVIAFVVLGNFRKRYRMQVNWSSCTAAGRRASANTERHHEDHKKCFLNRNKNRLPKTAHLKLSTSSPNRKCAPGNAYVCTTDRSLLSPNKKDTLNDDTLSTARPSSRGIDDDDVYESDPLYETPDSTWSSRGHGNRSHRFRRRQSSTSTQCYLIPSSKTTTLSERNVEQDGCPKVTSSRAVGTSPPQPSSSSSSSRPPPQPRGCHKKMSIDENGFEVPCFEAPPLPSRNSPNLELVTNDDHIYVNIDDVPIKRVEIH